MHGGNSSELEEYLSRVISQTVNVVFAASFDTRVSVLDVTRSFFIRKDPYHILNRTEKNKLQKVMEWRYCVSYERPHGQQG